MSSGVKTNTQSLELLKKAKTKGIFSIILSGIGGGLTGTPIGTSIAGGDPNWTLAGIGIGCFAIALPIAISTDKNIKQAVENYNSSLNPTTLNHSKPELNIIANVQGAGFSINF
ncbi:hypothetical protein DHD05_08035 [Arenibacter sp. N53]|uniref:hypothetical protein n=1 Tax=Arenibacter TaxID=178469 RepID=UPI000CD463E4|nr:MULTISPECIES: hypothetical protein [Arenibacter]MCM4151535.1 hypothetical protein [Arenibacter sp. N53]